MFRNVDEQQLAERLYRHVDCLADLIGPRHPLKPVALKAAAGYIEREFSALGYSVERQAYDVDHGQVANLVMEVTGTRRGQEVLIIGAHYDTIPTTPGADDNASAIAMLIEIARLLRDSSFQRTLRFVAFPCEEPPYFYTDSMGSQVYARQCRLRGEQIVGMICLEMVGYYRDEPNSQQLPSGIPSVFRWAFPTRGDFLAAVGNFNSLGLVWSFRRGFKHAVAFPLYSIVLPNRIPEIHLSDNSSFWDQGYPALMVTDTAFLRNPHYHSTTDTPDTLDYNCMARGTIGVAGGVARLAKVLSWRTVEKPQQ